MTYTGIVRWFDGNIGFIGRDDGQGDVFVPFRELAKVPLRYIDEGDKVTFSIGSDSRGRPVATEVELVERPGLGAPRVRKTRAWRAAEKVLRPVRQEDVFRE